MTRRLPLLGTVAVVVAPLVVLAARVLLDDASSPGGDVGLIEVRVRDVGGDRTPLLGSYSRFGFNQPGPALLYALAVPYRLLGARYAGIELGALAINAASLLAVLVVAWRRARVTGVVGAGAILAVFVHGLGPAWLVDPWEPHVLVLPAVALLVLAAHAVAGRPWTLPMVAGLASFLAQASMTLLPCAVALGAWAAVGVAADGLRRPARRPRVLRTVATTVLVLLVVWAAPLVEQLQGDPGNVTELVEGLRSPEATVGVADAWRLVSLELGHRATWLGSDQPLDGLAPTADVHAAPSVPLLAVALAAAAAAVAGRDRRSPALVLVATAGVGTLAAVAAMARLIPPVFAWIPRWLQAVGVGVALAAGAATRSALRHVDGVERVAVPLLALVASAASAVTVTAAVGEWREPDLLRDAVAELAAVGAAEVAAGDGPVLVRSRLDANLAFGGQDVASEVLVLGLERRGARTVVDLDAENRFGPERARPHLAELELRLVGAAEAVPEGFAVLATVDPLGEDGRHRRERLLEEAGLPPDATDRDLLVPISRDPALRRIATRLEKLPDLPPVSLLVGPAAARV